MEMVEIKDLSFSYPDSEEPVLNHLSCSIKKGDFVIIAGASGCGKTTLLRLLKKELAPHGQLSGNIEVTANNTGFVSQNPDTQIVTDKVYNELAFGLENLAVPKHEILRRVGETAGFFGIADKWRADTDRLSGGEKQLLNLASVMVTEPELLLLDEPTAQLDPIAASDFLSLLIRLNKELGITVVLTEHRLESIFDFADKILIMDKGAISIKGSPKKAALALQKHKNHPVVPALPVALRIYAALDVNSEPPLSIKEGKKFLSAHFKNNIRALPEEDKVTDTILSLKKASFRYEKKLPDILMNASVKFFQGEIFSIIGQNGAGKTTLLKVLSGISKPYAGKRALKKGLTTAMLPQNPRALFLYDRAEDELKEAGGGTIPDDIMKRFDLTPLLKRHPYDLSGGEMQKLALAKTLLKQPNILLLDEPAKGLDAAAKQSLCETLKSLKDIGITTVLVTHDLEFAAMASNRCALFFDGKVLAPDKPSAFFSKNHYYTTAASKLSRHMFDGAVTADAVIRLCKTNGERHE